ncbi:MAG: TRAP transporter permease [Deltaproteobacteria bacterium]|nr:TRAP transporter permease [Deltaproteobacteria bacterium]
MRFFLNSNKQDQPTAPSCPSFKSSRLKTRSIALTAVLWALFQLSTASFLILDSIKIRSIHLAFAVFLVFLTIPHTKTPLKQKESGIAGWLPLLDIILAVSGAFFSLYIQLDWEGLSLRAGDPSLRDLILGSALILVLLEAARRSIGPSLPVIVILFSLYAFFGAYMPETFAFQGVSFRKYLSQVSLSSEGIYGIPLGVSASIVFLFVLLGSMLDKAGAGQFFTRLAMSVLGKYKGGPAKAAVVSSGLSGMISGSSIANIVTTGTFTIPLMKKVGYPAKKAAAVEVAASTDGQLMPPIMGAAAFIIAEYVNISYLEVVKAAIIPAFVSYFTLFYVTHLEASKLGMKGLDKKDLPDFFAELKKGLHYLIPIFILIFELVILRHSPELSAFRAIMGLILITFYQEIRKSVIHGKTALSGIKNGLYIIKEGLISGSKNMLGVAVATAAAGIIVGIVGLGLGGMITQLVETLSMGNIFLLLLITAFASLLLGMGLPTTATYIVMASLTAPVIVQVGAGFQFFIPLIAAHLFCFYFGILADDTPPVGLASYAAAAIAGSNPIETGIQGFLYDLRTAVIPFLFIFNTELILYGVTSWLNGVLIFLMAVLGAFCFSSVIQGWFIVKVRWFEIAPLLLASLLLFHPLVFNRWLQLPRDQRYWMYLPGLVLMLTVYLSQLHRQKNNPVGYGVKL